MTRSKPISILIPDATDSPILFRGLLNSLSLIKDINIYAISSTKTPIFKYSRYIKRYFIYLEKNNTNGWLSKIQNIAAKYNIDLVVPIEEKSIEIFLEHKHLFSTKSVKMVDLPPLQSFQIARSKSKLANFMNENNLSCAKNIVIKSGVPYNSQAINYPVLAKPVQGFSAGDGILKFHDHQSLEAFFNKNNKDYEYLIEEFIEGYDLGCNLLCFEGNILMHTIQKGTLWDSKPYSPQVGLKFTESPEIFDVVQKLMASLNWSGLANVDMRYDVNSNSYKILEINPRVWQTIDASTMAGVNFPYLHILSSLNYSFPEIKHSLIDYLSLKGIWQMLKQNKAFIFRFKFLFKNTQFKFLAKDPIPMCYTFYLRLKGLIKNNE
jgi:predicted ATP-grasp superfamily ATP-dependent carboligase